MLWVDGRNMLRQLSDSPFLSLSHQSWLLSPRVSSTQTPILSSTLIMIGAASIITLFGVVKRWIQMFGFWKAILLLGDRNSSSISETVVKLGAIWPIYLLRQKPPSVGQLELGLPIFQKSPKLRLMARCFEKLSLPHHLPFRWSVSFWWGLSCLSGVEDHLSRPQTLSTKYTFDIFQLAIFVFQFGRKPGQNQEMECL